MLLQEKKQWGNINIDSDYSRRQRYRPGQSERVEEEEGGGVRESEKEREKMG